MSVPFEEALQQAVWDLAAKAAGLPLWKMLGARRDRVRAYASGLDFHLSDEDFGALFAAAAEQGYTAFKIKVGHAELDRDIHRLDLLKRSEEHTSELQSLMRISYAVFCLKKKKQQKTQTT